MINEKSSADTIINSSDFDKKDCQKILDELPRIGYRPMYDAFSKVARKSNVDNPKKSKIYSLLADACSMTLTHDSITSPFKPLINLYDRRSAIPNDFSEEEILFFSDIIPKIDDIYLKARLSDLVWCTASQRDLKNAILAIDSYIKIPLDIETWLKDGEECWYRATNLAKTLKTKKQLEEIKKKILCAFDSATILDGYLALWLADLIANFGIYKDNPKAIPKKLEELAVEFDNNSDLNRAEDYFRESSKWYNLTGSRKKFVEMTACFAEINVKIASSNSSNTVAASFYENAIQILRTIPRSERTALKIEKRIEELHNLMHEAGELSLSEMGIISSEGIDISQQIEYAQQAVSGKHKFDALKSFANIFPGINIEEMKAESLKQSKRYILPSIFNNIYRNKHGRIVAKTNGDNLNNNIISENSNVQAITIRNYCYKVSLIVSGYILPSLEIIHLEHIIKEKDFMDIANQASIVPPNREYFFSKGILAGYEHDFITALHIIIPQIENMVRFHLKNAGAKTTTLDSYGIETENGLNTLVNLPEMRNVFGDDLTFEIKTLFCNPLGANLRNELAHGLMDFTNFYSEYSVYAWWFCLKLVFNTFWNNSQKVN